MIHVDFSEGKAEMSMAGDGNLIVKELALLVDNMVYQSKKDLSVEEVLTAIRVNALAIGKIRKGLRNED